MFNFEIQFIKQIIKNKCGFNSLFIIRFFYQWKKSLKKKRSPIIDRIPWMTFQSISLIEKKLKLGSSVFEYGSGGSTLYFLDRGAKLVTVEHDKKWFDYMSEVISYENLSNYWTAFYEPPEKENFKKNTSQPNSISYKSRSELFIGKTFENYVNVINQFPNEYFDFVIIDGRSRSSCLKQSVLKVKVGGYLVLDNTERDYYLSSETEVYLKKFNLELDKIGPSPYVNFFTKTNIWKRVIK